MIDVTRLVVLKGMKIRWGLGVKQRKDGDYAGITSYVESVDL